MRNKFLLLILSFVCLSISFSSCLGDDNNSEYSTSTWVYAFGIDSIYGKYYKFSIDQYNKLIYNKDSLPFSADTIIDSIKIDTFTVLGAIYSGVADTLFTAGDYADLTPAVNGGSLKFKIYAADGVTYTTYRLMVNMHKQDPDSLQWQKVASLPSGFAKAKLGDNQKIIYFNKQIFIYNFNSTSSIKAYTTAAEGTPSWSTKSVSGLPSDVKMKTIITFDDKLYVSTEGGDVYNTSDGISWSEVSALSGDVTALLVGMSDKLWGVMEKDGTDYYCYTSSESESWTTGDQADAAFPTEAISSVTYKTVTNIEKAALVGMPVGSTMVIPWSTMSGNTGWASWESSTAYCPAMEHPSILYYGGQFYMLGDGLECFYGSTTGLAWSQLTSKFMLPESVIGYDTYSITVDDNDYLWLVAAGSTNQLWRGRLNKLGFITQ